MCTLYANKQRGTLHNITWLNHPLYTIFRDIFRDIFNAVSPYRLLTGWQRLLQISVQIRDVGCLFANLGADELLGPRNADADVNY
jgi:hypothetical protein